MKMTNGKTKLGIICLFFLTLSARVDGQEVPGYVYPGREFKVTLSNGNSFFVGYGEKLERRFNGKEIYTELSISDENRHRIKLISAFINKCTITKSDSGLIVTYLIVARPNNSGGGDFVEVCSERYFYDSLNNPQIEFRPRDNLMRLTASEIGNIIKTVDDIRLGSIELSSDEIDRRIVDLFFLRHKWVI
ncbi:MAG: hypothetical protein FWJ85_00030 [Solitalea sp.]